MNETQQAVDILNKHREVYVCLPKNSEEDGVLAAVALAKVLRGVGKRVLLVSETETPERISRLVEGEQFGVLPFNSDRLVVELDTTAAELGQLSYETSPGKVSIFLQSKNGEFSVNNVTVAPYFSQEVLLVMLGSPNPESLGELFTGFPGIFYRLPKLVVDNDLSNERFGNVNFVDPTAGSLSELVFKIIEKLVGLEQVRSGATQLLAGVLSATSGLKNNKTTPDSFAVASRLVSAGADHSLAASTLFKSVGFPEIKLLGRVLSGMEFVEEGKFGYMVLDRKEFGRDIASYAETEQVLTELATNIGEIKGMAVFEDKSGEVVMYMLGSLPPEFLNAVVPKGASFEPLPHIAPTCQRARFTATPLEIRQKIGAFVHKEV